MKRPTEAEAPGAPERGRSSGSALDHVVALMRAQLVAIRNHDPGTRLGRDPEELHQMRTAVRRLRAILRAVGSALDPACLKPLRAELKWLAGALGAVRDLDVMREYLQGELTRLGRTDRGAGRRILSQLDVERARAREQLLRALDAPRYLTLLDRVGKAIERPRTVAADLSLRDIAAGEFKKLRKAVRALPKKPSAPDLHAVRIKVKRARYAAELAQATVGRPAQRFARSAKKLQDILGEHQDAVVVEERLRAFLHGARHTRAALVVERLVKGQRVRQRAARAAFRKRWPKLKERGRDAWA